jgi:hypothetical protein
VLWLTGGEAMAQGSQPASSASAATASAPAFDQSITLPDGQPIPGRLEALRGGKLTWQTAGGVREFELSRLMLVRLRPAGGSSVAPGHLHLLLAGDFALSVQSVQVENGKLTARSDLLGDVEIDLSAVRQIVLPGPDQTAVGAVEAAAQLNLPPVGKSDRLLALDRNNQLQPFEGVLQGIAGGKVAFRLGTEDRTIDQDRVLLVQLAALEGSGSAKGGLLLADASQLPYDELTLTQRAVAVAGPVRLARPVPLEAIGEIRPRSEGLVYVSDLKPAAVESSGLFGQGWPWRADRGTTGKPLTLGGVTYGRGLGLHSRTALTYDIAGKYAAMVGLAGIDDNAGRSGDAVLLVRGDGKELLGSLRLRAGQPPQPLRVDVRGVRQLTILVDYGPDELDAGDHVSLAQLRLVEGEK